MTLNYIYGIKFIGDLSLQDADILAKYAKQSKSILEFGAGGSTQVMSQCNADSIISVETDLNWATLTNIRLGKLNTNTKVKFVEYTTLFEQQFDLIFVDGVSNLRPDFASNTWKYLKPGGVMIFHDTRVQHEFQNIISVTIEYHNEVEQIDVNAKASNNVASNMTVIHKKECEPYINWNKSEDKPMWAYGGFDQPDQELWEYKP